MCFYITRVKNHHRYLREMSFLRNLWDVSASVSFDSLEMWRFLIASHVQWRRVPFHFLRSEVSHLSVMVIAFWSGGGGADRSPAVCDLITPPLDQIQLREMRWTACTCSYSSNPQKVIIVSYSTNARGGPKETAEITAWEFKAVSEYFRKTLIKVKLDVLVSTDLHSLWKVLHV